MKKYLFLLLIFSLSCNNDFPNINLEVGFSRIAPPQWYKEIWNETYKCAGNLAVSNRKYEHIKWYVVDGETFLVNGQAALGMYIEDRIFLASSAKELKWVIQHEQMHAITKIKTHPVIPFESCKLLYFQQ